MEHVHSHPYPSPPLVTGGADRAGLILSALTSRVAPRAGSRAAAECKTTEKSVAEPERAWGWIFFLHSLFGRPQNSLIRSAKDCDDCLYQNNWSTAQKITELQRRTLGRVEWGRPEIFPSKGPLDDLAQPNVVCVCSIRESKDLLQGNIFGPYSTCFEDVCSRC